MLWNKRALGAALATVAVALAVGTGVAAQAGAEERAGAEQQAGPAAVRAVDGIQLVTLPNANVPNFQRRTVLCPSGKRALGGGAEARGNDATLVGSFPTDDGRGWIGLGRQGASSSVGISVFVICANA
ncbi:hypothetical protein ACIA8O_35400 [Kitasatospora sp. NPDC051853]|uniref:hypothetical protein n=1 Tax=Kitasatospora sp. NPDC051853 TaxID=3364058 RepID=UPI0037A454E4